MAEGQLTALVKTRLKRMQYRPGLLDGFVAKTGLDLTPSLGNPRLKISTLRQGLHPEGVALRAVRLTGRDEPGAVGGWPMTSASGPGDLLTGSYDCVDRVVLHAY